MGGEETTESESATPQKRAKFAPLCAHYKVVAHITVKNEVTAATREAQSLLCSVITVVNFGSMAIDSYRRAARRAVRLAKACNSNCKALFNSTSVPCGFTHDTHLHQSSLRVHVREHVRALALDSRAEGHASR